MSMEEITRDAHLALCEEAGVAVTIQRGDDTADFVAVPGSTPFTQESPGAGSIEFVSRDWLILADRYVLAGVRTKPQRSDKVIERKSNGDVFVYEVLPGDGQPEWRWSDSYGVVLRVFTKQIQKEGEGV